LSVRRWVGVVGSQSRGDLLPEGRPPHCDRHTPAGRVVHVVREAQAVQHDGSVGGVVQLDPVRVLARITGVLERAAVLGHELVDHQARSRHRKGLGVGPSWRGVRELLPGCAPVRRPAVGHILLLASEVDGVDRGPPVRVKQGDGLAVRTELEARVRGALVLVSIRPDQEVLPGLDLQTGDPCSQGLVQEGIPQVKGQGQGPRAVGRDGGPQDPEVGCLAPHALRVRRGQPVCGHPVCPARGHGCDVQGPHFLELQDVLHEGRVDPALGVDEPNLADPRRVLVCSEEDPASHETPGQVRILLHGQVCKGREVGSRKDGHVGIRRGGGQRQDPRDHGDLRGHAIREQDVIGLELMGLVGLEDTV